MFNPEELQMTKKNYQAKQSREYEKADPIARSAPTNCFKCDGYDMYCSKYKAIHETYTSQCITKRNLQPGSRLEEMLYG